MDKPKVITTTMILGLTGLVFVLEQTIQDTILVHSNRIKVDR